MTLMQRVIAAPWRSVVGISSIVAVLAFSGCAISRGPLAPEGDPTPSGAESTPAPNPIAGTVETDDDPINSADLQNARETMARMQALNAAIAAYRDANGHYPRVSSVSQLAAALASSPDERPETSDAWGRPLRYEVRSGGDSYVLASSGADGNAAASTWDTPATLSDPDDDIVYRDGAPLRIWPER